MSSIGYHLLGSLRLTEFPDLNRDLLSLLRLTKFSDLNKDLLSLLRLTEFPDLETVVRAVWGQRLPELYPLDPHVLPSQPDSTVLFTLVNHLELLRNLHFQLFWLSEHLWLHLCKRISFVHKHLEFWILCRKFKVISGNKWLLRVILCRKCAWECFHVWFLSQTIDFYNNNHISNRIKCVCFKVMLLRKILCNIRMSMKSNTKGLCHSLHQYTNWQD